MKLDLVLYYEIIHINTVFTVIEVNCIELNSFIIRAINELNGFLMHVVSSCRINLVNVKNRLIEDVSTASDAHNNLTRSSLTFC